MTEFSGDALGIDPAQKKKAAYESNGKATNGNINFMTLKTMLKNLYLDFEYVVVTLTRESMGAYIDSSTPIHTPRG